MFYFQGEVGQSGLPGASAVQRVGVGLGPDTELAQTLPHHQKDNTVPESIRRLTPVVKTHAQVKRLMLSRM